MSTSEPILISRTFDAELAAGDGRTIVGRCVPYGVPAMVAEPGGQPYMECWRRGAFRCSVKAPHRLRLVYEHGATIGDCIGHATELREADDGLHAVFRAIGAPGDQALELIRAQVVTGLSIEALVPPSGSRLLADGVLERTLATLQHVALTATPAYVDAQVMATRSSSSSAPSIAEIRARQADLRLRFAAERA